MTDLDEKDKELDRLIYDTYGIVESEPDETKLAPRKPPTGAELFTPALSCCWCLDQLAVALNRL